MQFSCLAEGVGFEPTVPIARDSGFQDRPVRPLRHPSEPSISVYIILKSDSNRQSKGI